MRYWAYWWPRPGCGRPRRGCCQTLSWSRRRWEPPWQARHRRSGGAPRVKPRLANTADMGSRAKARVQRAVGGARAAVPHTATLGGVPGEWTEADGAVSGGTPDTLVPARRRFVGCSPKTHWSHHRRLLRDGFRCLCARLPAGPPEHLFPAAPDDALAVHRALRAQHRGGRLVVAGESAGGNLTLACWWRSRDAGEALPDAVAMFSPSTDSDWRQRLAVAEQFARDASVPWSGAGRPVARLFGRRRPG